MISKSLNRPKMNVFRVTTVSFYGFERCHMILTVLLKVPPPVVVFMQKYRNSYSRLEKLLRQTWKTKLGKGIVNILLDHLRLRCSD